MLRGVGDTQSDALTKAGESCLAMQSTKLKTAAEREAAFKAAAKCTAEAACTIYSKGAIPPGTCSTIVGPVADGVVKVWNAVYDLFSPDDAHERAVLAAQTAVPSAYAQLDKVDRLFYAHYLNVAAGLIDMNDSLLPGRKGQLGGGNASTGYVTGGGKYIAAFSFPYKSYSNNRAVMQRLAQMGAPAAGCASGATWCAPPKVLSLYSAWAQSHATADSIAQLKKMNELSVTAAQWMDALNVAAMRVQNEIAGESAKEKVLLSGAVKLLGLRQPMSPVTKTVLVAGAGGLLWWIGKKVLL